MVTNSGVEYDSEIACASGRWPMAQKPQNIDDHADHAADEVARQLRRCAAGRGPCRASSGSGRDQAEEVAEEGDLEGVQRLRGQPDRHRHQPEEQRAAEHQQRGARSTVAP